MIRKRIEPGEIAVDGSGRVVLSDADLEQACSDDLFLAGGGTINGSGCTNAASCGDSFNSRNCTNTGSHCEGAINWEGCREVRSEQ